MNETINSNQPWFRQGTMLLCAAILTTTVLVGSVMLTLAIRIDDPLVMDEQSYQELRDDFRLTEGRAVGTEPDSD